MVTIDLGISERPLAGFSHGASGIASALLTATELLGDNRYRDAAARALAYERELFIADEGNWRDLRNTNVDESVVSFEGDRSPPDTDTNIVAWCNGAPGIGIARLHAIEHFEDPVLRAELDVAIATTLRSGFGNNHALCHGDFGNLEFLALAAERTADPDLRLRVERQATTILRTIDEHGWRCGLHKELELPGLLNGIAGIGYGALRLLAPARIPSVLALEPPRRAPAR